MKVEIRVSEKGKNWEDVNGFVFEFDSWREAADEAKKLSKKEKKEVRVNRIGSLQGHYFSEF